MSTPQQSTETPEQSFLNFEQYDFAKDKKFQAGLPSIMSRLSKLGGKLDKDVYDRELLKAKGFYYNKFISAFSFPEYLAWTEEKKKESAPKCPFAHMWQNKGTKSVSEASGSSFLTEKSQDREGPVQIILSSVRTQNVLKQNHIAKLSHNFKEYINEEKITAFILDADCGGSSAAKDPTQLIATKDDRFFCNGLNPESDPQSYLRMAYQLYKLGEKKPTVSLVNGLVDRNVIYLPWLCTDKLITEHARVTFSLSDDPESMLSNPLAGLYLLSRFGRVDDTKIQPTAAAKQMPNGVALYIALCPDFVIRGPDIIKLLLGDCFIPSGKSQELLESIKAVAGCPPPYTKQAIKVTYYPQNTYPGPSLIEVWRDEIEDCFSNVDGVEDIISRLGKYSNEWAKNIAAYLKSQSPTLLKVIFRAVLDAKSLSFEECLKLEYRVAIKFRNTPDYKTLKTQLSEQDPKVWSPASLEETSKEYVDTFFTPLTEAEGEELDLEYVDQVDANEEEESESEQEHEVSLVENKIGQSIMSQCPVTGLVFTKPSTIADANPSDPAQDEGAQCPFLNGQKVQGECPVTGTKPSVEIVEALPVASTQESSSQYPFLSGKAVEGQCPITGVKPNTASAPLEAVNPQTTNQCPFLSGEKVEGQCPITGASNS
ncbi:hypothetical protein K493DRAFT_338544 [Basidiobolus meristosporus CBS 931.73]|uniref:3-hydroxyisobutyryl-CoA hydrolase n=1 Tax=Basidiobolus meristosporus CBS 931.73 TaxID=1314790 RepID=A0A1Y1Y5R3_9FUNG|nr:hypothetical protein K493DRAFT_338544 [Basidiobolus meristosporus CBS 931.73]|eukprot:ORX92944.1 hypothetical protein K493DRAFT_338544 [Basidiobolus meristosporus CBS 931.73]